MPKIFHYPHKNPPVAPPTYFKYGPLGLMQLIRDFTSAGVVGEREIILSVVCPR